MLTKLCLLIITACSVAFIWFEYKPSLRPEVPTEARFQPNFEAIKQGQDWRCYSNKFTEKFKREIGRCYE